ncbi:hypothetical protein [Burkholderia sp. WSM2230]|uniref:hypothetical protein n=1 Tax=Burkholderia sp. WSM2230 TaxID=944435 RepID=UPI0012EB68C9|nr:hypothetical protein [Burkholderia sp. WSM2230]
MSVEASMFSVCLGRANVAPHHVIEPSVVFDLSTHNDLDAKFAIITLAHSTEQCCLAILRLRGDIAVVFGNGIHWRLRVSTDITPIRSTTIGHDLPSKNCSNFISGPNNGQLAPMCWMRCGGVICID